MDKKYCKIQGINEIFEIKDITDNKVTVLNKNKTITTSLDKIQFVENVNISSRSTCSLTVTSKDVPNEIMLRHKFKEEAISMLDKYLDQAYMAKLGRVRIIHGRHGGILRNAVHEYLKDHPYVKEFYIADYSEGGIGVTIAVLGKK